MSFTFGSPDNRGDNRNVTTDLFKSLQDACERAGTNLRQVCAAAGVRRSLVEKWKYREPKTVQLLGQLNRSILDFEKRNQKPMRVYICGLITNGGKQEITDEVVERFERAERKIRLHGYEPVSPLRLPHDHDKKHESYMAECLSDGLDTCEAIYLLSNWRDSAGARIEKAYAEKKSKKILFEG